MVHHISSSINIPYTQYNTPSYPTLFLCHFTVVPYYVSNDQLNPTTITTQESHQSNNLPDSSTVRLTSVGTPLPPVWGFFLGQGRVNLFCRMN